MKETRSGLDIKPRRRTQDEKTAFQRWNALYARIDSLSEQDFRTQCIQEMAQYAGIELRSDEDMEMAYERLKQGIIAAHSSFAGFTEHILVKDLEQGLSPTNDISHITDPGLLFEAMMNPQTTTRVRFETRRALWLGIYFWKFEREIGTQEELQRSLRGLDLYLSAILKSTPSARTVDMFHDMHIAEDGSPRVDAVRIPYIDKTEDTYVNGENKVSIALREMPHPSREGEKIFFTISARPKSRLSAIMKCIRKGEGFDKLLDILGLTITVVQKHGDELQSVVEFLDKHFQCDSKDRDVHPLRAGQQGNDTMQKKQKNVYSSAAFQVEKMITRWDMARLHSYLENIHEVLSHYFSTQRAKNKFKDSIHALNGKTFPLEIQVMTMEDMIKVKLSEAQVNHGAYEVTRTAAPIKDFFQNISTLQLFFPKEVFGVDWDDPEVRAALVRKQLATMGLRQKVLDILKTGQ